MEDKLNLKEMSDRINSMMEVLKMRGNDDKNASGQSEENIERCNEKKTELESLKSIKETEEKKMYTSMITSAKKKEISATQKAKIHLKLKFTKRHEDKISELSKNQNELSIAYDLLDHEILFIKEEINMIKSAGKEKNELQLTNEKLSESLRILNKELDEKKSEIMSLKSLNEQNEEKLKQSVILAEQKNNEIKLLEKENHDVQLINGNLNESLKMLNIEMDKKVAEIENLKSLNEKSEEKLKLLAEQESSEIKLIQEEKHDIQFRNELIEFMKTLNREMEKKEAENQSLGSLNEQSEEKLKHKFFPAEQDSAKIKLLEEEKHKLQLANEDLTKLFKMLNKEMDEKVAEIQRLRSLKEQNKKKLKHTIFLAEQESDKVKLLEEEKHKLKSANEDLTKLLKMLNKEMDEKVAEIQKFISLKEKSKKKLVSPKIYTNFDIEGMKLRNESAIESMEKGDHELDYNDIQHQFDTIQHCISYLTLFHKEEYMELHYINGIEPFQDSIINTNVKKLIEKIKKTKVSVKNKSFQTEGLVEWLEELTNVTHKSLFELFNTRNEVCQLTQEYYISNAEEELDSSIKVENYELEIEKLRKIFSDRNKEIKSLQKEKSQNEKHLECQALQLEDQSIKINKLN